MATRQVFGRRSKAKAILENVAMSCFYLLMMQGQKSSRPRYLPDHVKTEMRKCTDLGVKEEELEEVLKEAWVKARKNYDEKL